MRVHLDGVGQGMLVHGVSEAVTGQQEENWFEWPEFRMILGHNF